MNESLDKAYFDIIATHHSVQNLNAQLYKKLLNELGCLWSIYPLLFPGLPVGCCWHWATGAGRVRGGLGAPACGGGGANLTSASCANFTKTLGWYHIMTSLQSHSQAWCQIKQGSLEVQWLMSEAKSTSQTFLIICTWPIFMKWRVK